MWLIRNSVFCIQQIWKLEAGSVEYSEAQPYVCSHVEADTRMAYHLSVLSKAVPRQNTVVHSTNTDVMVILLSDVMVILLYDANKLEANVRMNGCWTFE